MNPLPFRIRVPGYDSLDAQGILSISIKLEGLLNLLNDRISLEWAAVRRIESVSLSGVIENVDESPVGRCEISLDLILDARLRGWWWAPILVMRARNLETFTDIPTAKNGVAKLSIRRKDRELARAICAAITDAQLGA
jgi:hypothetical protein